MATDGFILLRQSGEPSGGNRIYRLYREEGLSVRKRQSRRRAVGTRAPILVEARANARWSLDFIHDQFASGHHFRVLNIFDDVKSECLASIPDTSISGRRIVRELVALMFLGLDHAREKVAAWVDDYNNRHKHSALATKLRRPTPPTFLQPRRKT